VAVKFVLPREAVQSERPSGVGDAGVMARGCALACAGLGSLVGGVGRLCGENYGGRSLWGGAFVPSVYHR